jgi:hypothetical protein
MKPVREWISCWGSVFTPAPTIFPGTVCDAKKFLADALEKIQGLRQKIRDNLGVFAWLVDPMGKLEEEIMRKVEPILREMSLKVVGFLLGREFENILRVITEGVDDASLDRTFTATNPRKKFILIPDVSKRMRSDMNLREDGYFDPEKFNAAYNAVVLAKMTLLEPDQLNKVLIDNGGSGDHLYYRTMDFNVLNSMVRSIDGNHQWNEYAPPYHRTEGTDTYSRADRSYGYEGGFLFWKGKQGQRKVFPTIFHGPLAPAMEDAKANGFQNLIPKDYWYYRPSKKDPFPQIRDYDDPKWFQFWRW